ncbi:glycosyltransferase [Belliella sp. R4-6]|uniref:Glycosyltransferase n=1 Tax=Belliella alkalica TaxID=1730871 RepID=A0ABS9V7X7_9BACT|nr:glycosyltransferase [Belliella alkalica]MCH7412058.1 glycosyltransferase [Belliella alkalica]
MNPGGIETYLLRFLKFIKDDRSIEPYVLIRSLDQGKLFEQYKVLGIPLFFHPLGYFNLKNIFWFYDFVKRKKFDSVCDFNANFAGIPMWLAKQAGINNRIAFYRQGKDHFKVTFLRKLYNSLVKNLVFTSSTQILSNSKASLNFFFPGWQKSERFKVIYNGMNVDDFHFHEKNLSIRAELGIPLEAFVICHSGRLDPAKNHKTMLKVAKQLIERDKSIFFIFCGLSTEKLQDEVDSMGIMGNVKLLSFRNDVSEILRTSNLFYFPSLTEGQPNSLIEAMLCGLPFVASNIPPIVEIMPESLMSYLIDPLDVEKSVRLIFEVQEKKDHGLTGITQNWARGYFSQDLRFKEFYNCLIN